MSHFATVQTRTNHFASGRSDRAVLWNDMTLERRLHKVEQDLRSSPFGDLTPQLASGQIEVTDTPEMTTAATDGFNIYYDREFCMKQSPEGLAFIMMHEAEHKSRKDLVTYADLFAKDAELAGISCDISNNTSLLARDPKQRHIAIPVDINGKPFPLCYDPKRFPLGTSVYAIFRELMADKQQGGNPAAQYQPLDDHDHEGAAEQFAQGGEGDSSVERIIDRANSDGKRIRQAQQRFEASLDGGAGKGNGAGSGADMDSAFAQVHVPWTTVLNAEFQHLASGKDSTTFGRINRRTIALDAGRRIIRPCPVTEQIGPVLVACDTSGSVTDDEHALHMGGMATLVEQLNPEFVDVLYWGTAVEGHERYSSHNMHNLRDAARPRKSGGTQPSVIQDWLARPENRLNGYEAIVIFTDGALYGDWGRPEWPAPVFWCVSDPRQWNQTPTAGRLVEVLH